MRGDKLPPTIFKFFSDLEHANSFAQDGRIRLRTQNYFTQIEDKTRVDESEGKAKLRIPDTVTHISLETGVASQKPGILNYEGFHSNPIFLYCMALPEVDFPSRLSVWPYFVQITDPAKFAADLKESLGRHIPDGHQLADFEFAKVIYNKGAVVEKPTPEERSRLSFTQKPPEFIQECECRFVITLDIVAEPTEDEIIDVQLSRHKGYTAAAKGVGIA